MNTNLLVSEFMFSLLSFTVLARHMGQISFDESKWSCSLDVALQRVAFVISHP